MPLRRKKVQRFEDTAANWTAEDPILPPSWEGVESDTGKWKQGDGATAWSALPYRGTGGSDVFTGATNGGVFFAASELPVEDDATFLYDNTNKTLKLLESGYDVATAGWSSASPAALQIGNNNTPHTFGSNPGFFGQKIDIYGAASSGNSKQLSGIRVRAQIAATGTSNGHTTTAIEAFVSNPDDTTANANALLQALEGIVQAPQSIGRAAAGYFVVNAGGAANPTVTTQYGVFSQIGNAGAFTTTHAELFRAWAILGSGVVTNLYGLKLSGWSGTGVVNSYGIYIDTSIDLGTTLKYALYSLSTSPSLFSGPVSGVSNPYDATSWNGSLKFTTEGAVRDKIETLAPSVNSAITYYVCPSGQTVANYDGDGLNTAVTPSDSNDGLTKATPLATIAAAVAKISGKVLGAKVTIQLADCDATKAYFPDEVEISNVCFGAPSSSILERAITGRVDTYPTAYVHINGNNTTPNNVNVTGAATYNGTTSTKDCAFLVRNSILRVSGMKINYFRAANGDSGAINAYRSIVYAETINNTSDHTNNDGHLVSGFYNTLICLGGAFNITNSSLVSANAGSVWQTYSPLGYASVTASHTGTNVFMFFCNEKSHGMFEGGTHSFSGAGTYSVLCCFTGSTINMCNDATTTTTFNGANITISDARQGSQIWDAFSTASSPTTFTSFLRRAFARAGSYIHYNGTTAGSSADSADGSSSIANGTFPYITKVVSKLEGYQPFGQISAPGTVPSNEGFLYVKDVAGTTGLFFKDDAQTEIQLNAAGGGATLGANTFTGAQIINVNSQQPLRIVRTATGQAQISMTAGGTNEWESFVFNAERWNGSTGTPSTLSDGMDILNFNGSAWQSGAYNGGTYESAGAFRLEADGNHAGGSVPGKWTIRTTPSGSTTPVERFSIRATGSVVIGNSSSALSTSATDGFLYVPTCAGTPTGAPTAITGVAPIVIDTTNHKLYFRSGGSWRDAGP